MSTRITNPKLDNLLSAPSEFDNSETENSKYTQRNGIFSFFNRMFDKLFSSRNTNNSSYNQPTTQQTQYTERRNVTYSTAGTILGMSTSFFLQMLLLIIVLAVLGINVFHYLGYGLDSAVGTASDVTKQTADTTKQGAQKTAEAGTTTISNILPITNRFLKQTAQATSDGIKGLTDIATGTVDKTVDLATGETGTDITKNKSSTTTKTDNNVNSSLKKSSSSKNDKKSEDDDKKSDDKDELEGGWCYIGSEGGIRSCARVSKNSECMSGEIFGTEDVCINPNLRE